MDATFTPIGVVRTPYARPEDAPSQATASADQAAVIEIDPAYADGLDGLAGFSHVWLVTWLHGSAGRAPLRVVPNALRGTGREMGVFATRAPWRPNPIGISLVRLRAVDGPRLQVEGIDLVDGTPVLDLKPYFADADLPDGAVRVGWAEGS